MVPIQHLQALVYTGAKTYFNAIYLYDPRAGWAIALDQFKDWRESCVISPMEEKQTYKCCR